MRVYSNTSERDTSDDRLVSLLRVALPEPNRIGIMFVSLLLVGGMLMSTGGSALAQSDVLDYVQSLFGGYGLRAAEDVVISPDGKYVYALGEYDNAVVLFERNEPGGELSYIATYVEGENNVSGLVYPTALTISDDGQNLYVLGMNAVIVFTRDVVSGELTYVETMSNGKDGVENMFGPDALDVSPDGTNVYVVGDIALTIFERDAADEGKLSFVESVQGDTEDVNFQFRDVVVANDKIVYASSYDFSSIFVLARNAADKGRVTVLQTVTNGESGVSGISGVEKLAATSDGQNLYASGSISSTVAVFDRATDGKLSFLEFYTNGQGGVDGIGGARALAASQDGKSVYIAGTKDDALAEFTRAGDGRLSFGECFTSKDTGNTCQKGISGLRDPSAIAIDPSGQSLYVTGRESKSLSHYTRNTSSGEIAFEKVLYDQDGGISGMGGARDVAVSPDGKHAYVVSVGEDAIVVYQRSIASNGELTYVEDHANGTGGILYMSHPSAVAVSPDGKSVYVSSDGADDATLGSVTVFSREASTGKLTWVETKLNSEGGISGLAGAYDVVVSPDDNSVYVTGITDGTIAVFARDTASGKLTQVQLEMQGVSGVTGLAGAAGITISENGDHVYVAGSYSDAVAVFRRDATDGKLTWVEALTNDDIGIKVLNGPYSLDVSPDDLNVYVASAVSGLVVALKRDSATGKLQYLASYRGDNVIEGSEADLSTILAYFALSVSPDNKYVFAVRWTISGEMIEFTGNIVTFARDEASGRLSTAQVLTNGEGDIRGMRQPLAVAVSEDSANVYLISTRDSSVLTFKVAGSAPYTDRFWLPWLLKEE